MKKYWILAFGTLIASLSMDMKPILLISVFLFVVAFLKTIRGVNGSSVDGGTGEGSAYNGRDHNFDSDSGGFGESDGGGDGGGD